MTPDEERLLGSSYELTAQRVLEGIRGGLPVRNSRGGGPPSITPGMIVGLCGQGGRHVFFDVPVQDVEDATREILNLRNSRASGSSFLGSLQSICINLRQMTNFYPNSGCVNDRAPGLVPWMPPEEIWTDGGEIPLDLWRLLSFDIDVVSTTLNIALESADLSYTSLSQAALAFASLVRRAGDRIIEFDVREGSMPTDLSFGSGRFRCPLMRLLFEAGTLLTPLSQQDDFSRWFLVFRYLNWLGSGGLLRVKQDFRSRTVDSRYKGIFSEEMAIGMMAVVLQDVYGSIRINNTAEVITKPTSPVADFIVLGADKRRNLLYLAVECKGSLGSPVSSKRMLRAKQQAGNTKIPGAFASLGLVCSSTIYYENQRKRTLCTIEDPPALLDAGEVELDELLAWRTAYARLMRFIGLERASVEIASGEPAVSLPLFVDQERRPDEGSERRSIRRNRLRNLRERLHSESILDLGFGAVVVDSIVHKVLRTGLSNENIGILREYLSRETRRGQESLRESHSRVSFLNNLGVGLIVFEELSL